MFDFKKIDRKGRVIITETIREQAGIKTGDTLALYVQDGKIVVQKITAEVLLKK